MLEALAELEVSRAARGEDLDRDPPAEPAVDGLVDRAQPAAADLADDAVLLLEAQARRLRGRLVREGSPEAQEPVQGLVSDQDVEATLSSDELTRAQRTCVFDVLSDPPYRLETEDPRATPSRVGLVIEF